MPVNLAAGADTMDGAAPVLRKAICRPLVLQVGEFWFVALRNNGKFADDRVRDFAAYQAYFTFTLDASDFAALRLGTKSRGGAALSGATCTANAMDEVFRRLRLS
jgi:hypothetical protein